LVAYHFGSKQNLWNEAVDSIFEAYLDEVATLRHALRDVSARERGRALAMAYARFNAAHPEFYRFLILEGLTPTERSDRLGHHLRRAEVLFREIIGLHSSEGVDEMEQVIVLYLVIGAAGAPFAMPAYDALLREHVVPAADSTTHPAFVERFAEAVAALTLNGVGNLRDAGHPRRDETGSI
jgi:AcrR family transcriptional regulator